MFSISSLQKFCSSLAIASCFLINSSVIAATVDGNLADLIADIGSQTYNVASGTESGLDAEANGFDITNMYAHYDYDLDTFYLGMSMYGDLGTSGGDEGIMDWFGYSDPGTANVFDSHEHVGFNINAWGGSAEIAFNVFGDGDIDLTNNPYGATVNWAVNEAAGGVEFSISGLASQFGYPTDVEINFFAGSVSNFGPEDIATLNMTVVPVPAAAWLFISGIAGLLSVAHRRKNHTTV